MPLLLPDHIKTATEAVDAVQVFLGTKSPLSPFIWPAQHPLDEAQKLISSLDRDPGPGPVLRVHRGVEAPALVGRPKVPMGRSVHTVQLPNGPYRSTPGLEAISSSVGLVETATTVVIARALAAKAVMAAELESGRPGRYLRHEATELLDFADQLEAEIPDLGEVFLGRWRTEIDYLTPAPPPPVFIPATLR